MLTLNNLKYYCRTCLVKFEAELVDDCEEANKFAKISTVPEIEQMINLCLGPKTTDDQDLEAHMPNLCSSCFDKWLDFAQLYELLIKTNNKLRTIVERNILDSKSSDNGEETITETVTGDDAYQIEKYDTLSPFYADIRTSSSDREECVLSMTPANDNSNKLDNAYYELSDETVSLEDVDRSRSSSRVKRKSQTKTKQRKKIPNNASQDSHVVNKKLLYRCEPCKKYFYEIHKYEGHVKQVHEGIKRAYQCKNCDKAYPFYKNLRIHIALNHSLEPLETFKCDECDKMFKTKVTLKTHQTSKHQNVSKNSICDQCGFMATNQYVLKKHIKNKHSEPEQIKCEQCPKIFKNLYYLKYHTLNFHNPMSVKPYKCTECHKAFTRIALLNAHKRSHLEPSERIKCDFEGCDVRFLFNGEKARHMRLVHLKLKRYICDICGESFGTRPTLRHHRYIHTGEKPFNCNVCGQGFRQRSAMKTHQRTHSSKEEVTRG